MNPAISRPRRLHAEPHARPAATEITTAGTMYAHAAPAAAIQAVAGER